MNKYMKKITSIIVSIAILFSMVFVTDFKAEETPTEETSTVIETTQQETTSSEATPSETTSEEITSEESTSEEMETVVYNENQQRVVTQINSIPESNQEDFMDKVKTLYIDYLTLTEDEVKGISSKDKAQYENILAEAGRINHTDENTGISVSADKLPWYVKVVAEKTDETVFKENYDAYIESLLEVDYDDEEYEDEEYYEDYEDENYEDEDWEEYDEDLEYSDDEEYIDENSEDEYVEESEEDTYQEEALEDEENIDYWTEWYNSPRISMGYKVDDDYTMKIMDSYNIDLYNTLEDEKFVLPEGMNVKVSIPYMKEYLGNSIDVMHQKEDNGYDYMSAWLFNKSLDKILTNGLYEELYGEDLYYEDVIETESTEEVTEETYKENDLDDEEYEDDEYMEDDEENYEYDEEPEIDMEAYKKWVEEQNSKYNVDDYVIQFETDSFSEFAVCLNVPIYKTTGFATDATGPQKMEESISPKTGTNIVIPLVGLGISSLLIFICVVFYRRREGDIYGQVYYGIGSGDY